MTMTYFSFLFFDYLQLRFVGLRIVFEKKKKFDQTLQVTNKRGKLGR